MTYTNLNLPEATLKLLAEKGGIKCLADGDIAVENDNLDALRKVLKVAFPKTDKPVTGGCRYYHALELSWGATTSSHLPSIPASILVKELEEKPFQWGERVWVSDDNLNWKEALYIDKRDSTEFPFTALAKGHSSTIIWNYCQREKPKPSPLRITREMIKEKFGCQEFELVNEKG